MIHAFGSRLRGSGTVGLAAATYGSALVAMGTSVIMTRSMTTHDFGSYRYVIAAIGLGAVVANVGLPYSAARILTRQQGVAQARTIAGSIQLLCAALVIAGSLLAAFALIGRGHVDAAPLLLLAAGLLWTVSMQRHFMYTLRGSGKSREIAVQTILPPSIILCLVTGAALSTGKIGLGLALAITATAYLMTHVWTSTRLSLWRQRHLGPERLALLATQRTTGIPIYKGALISVGVGELVVVVGGAAIGERDFGYFALAMSLAAPVATLPTVIGMVHFRRFGQQDLLPPSVILSTAAKSASLGALGLAVGWLAFPWIFPQQMDPARTMFPLLALAFLSHGLADYVNQFLQAKGHGDRIKRAAYGVGLVNGTVALLSIPSWGVWGLVIAKLAGSTAYMTSMIALTTRRDHESS